MLPAAVEVEADTRLEEFAVGLGIDRELARLLLRETSAPTPVEEVELPAIPPQPMATPKVLDAGVQVTSPLTTSPPIVPRAVTTTPLSVEPAVVPPMATPKVLDAGVQVTSPLTTSPPIVPRAVTTTPLSVEPAVVPPMATPKVLDAGVQVTSPLTTSPPIVPRAVTTTPLSVEPTVVPPADPSPTPRAEIALPRAAEMPLVIPSAAAPALRDEDVLRWRAFIHRSSSGVREPAQEIAVQAASDEVLDPVGAPRRGLSEVDFTAATASLRGFALERRQILTSTVTPVGSTALTGVLPGDSPVNPAVLPVAGSAPPSVPVTVLADPLTTPLRVPDPALQHELRAEQFAEQVGRRMLQQIREDRWTVNLQLDPQRLGPMEIELQLEGNQVTAQVGVANAEVRHLLESALPKLRESLDSAGLNLANWSFAQSGAREYREFAQQSAAAAAKATPKGVEGAIEDEVPRRVTEDSASRVVDVYV